MPFFVNTILSLFLFAASLYAQDAALPIIREVIPETLYLQSGGLEQVGILIKGSNLDSIHSARVYKDGKEYRPILCTVTDSGPQIKKVQFLAASVTPLGNHYKVALVTEDNHTIPLSLKIEVVPAGDKRLLQPPPELVKAKKEKGRPKTLTISAEELPQISETLPSPLVIVVNGMNQKVILKGKNLEKVTEVRVRRSEKASSYGGKAGLIPFHMTPEGMELEVKATPDTLPGTKYSLDFIINKYVAAVVSFTVEANTPVASNLVKIETHE